MFDPKYADLMLLYGVSPMHAGSGQGLGVIDNPIQRERHTNWPFVQASGVKGAFRDHFERAVWMQNHAAARTLEARKQVLEISRKIFGKSLEDEREVDQAGAVSVSDARLLFFPVRSSVAPFVWITCPGILKRFQRDLQLLGMSAPPHGEDPLDMNACILRDEKEVIGSAREVLLEDLAVHPQADSAGQWDLWLAANLPDCSRLLTVSDQVFSAIVDTATEIQAQIAILFDTGTTKDGSLRYQELLPADSVLYVMTFFTGERTDDADGLLPSAVMEKFQQYIQGFIQMGGDWSLGRGICKIVRPVNGGKK
jgi:CRISPR-associated protein Cmr4